MKINGIALILILAITSCELPNNSAEIDFVDMNKVASMFNGKLITGSITVGKSTNNEFVIGVKETGSSVYHQAFVLQTEMPNVELTKKGFSELIEFEESILIKFESEFILVLKMT